MATGSAVAVARQPVSFDWTPLLDPLLLKHVLFASKRRLEPFTSMVSATMPQW